MTERTEELVDENLLPVIRYRLFRPGASAPEKGTIYAAAYDIRAWSMKEEFFCSCLQGEPSCVLGKILPSEIVVSPGETKSIQTGINLRIPEGYEIQMRSRSGLALKHSIHVLNSPGTIDADYDGDGEPFECKVILHNSGTREFTIKHGDRIAQIVVQKLTPHLLIEDFEDNPRRLQSNRSGGFGHTGIQ